MLLRDDVIDLRWRDIMHKWHQTIFAASVRATSDSIAQRRRHADFRLARDEPRFSAIRAFECSSVSTLPSLM